MEKTLQQRIIELENQIILLSSKLEDISNNVEEKRLLPYSKSGGLKDPSQLKSIDISTGMIPTLSGAVLWNDIDLRSPEYGEKPSGNPTKGYNRHSHSRYSGGALDIKTLEIVEYDITDWESDSDYNKHCQQFWRTLPKIKKEQNTSKENVEKIGYLDLIFNPDWGYDENNKPIGRWGVASYEIDVEKCYLVKRDSEGVIETDENGNEMKASLFNEDVTKTNIVWDKNAKVWRIYAVFAEEPEVTP